VSDVVSLDDYRQRRELEKLLRSSLCVCGNCGKRVIEHRSYELLICWSEINFGPTPDGEPA
jgi:hypothetical protein